MTRHPYLHIDLIQSTLIRTYHYPYHAFLHFSSPKVRSTALPYRPYTQTIPNHNSSSSSTGTRTTRSHMNSYCSSSPSTRATNPMMRKADFSHNNHDSSTTIYSSSHQSDSLYNEPTGPQTARILSSSMNNRWTTSVSPSRNRKYFSPSLADRKYYDDDDDEPPRQILLPIGGGIVGKLASSTTNLSYRKFFYTLYFACLK
jgi:hypothetical protein